LFRFRFVEIAIELVHYSIVSVLLLLN